ncbi:MAG: InlB B-repeat-containing protein [Opitutaceae bacterium]
MRTLFSLPRGLLLLIACITYGNFASAEATLSSADLHVLPEGETITVTGTGLADATAARMIWSAAGMQFPTTATPLDANTLEVVMPTVHQDIRDHHLLVETSSGSTIGLPAGYDEHTGTGAITNPFAFGTLVVRAGAVLSGDHFYQMVIVETGGVLEVASTSQLRTIIAEDGAVIDFESAPSTMHSTIFLHSPDTVILGTPPTDLFSNSIAEELTPISVSYGLETFAVGYPINVTIVGVGTTTASPDQQYYRVNTDVDLTANPGVNSTFSGWSGDKVSSSTSIEVRVESSALNLTVTFSPGWLLSIYDIPGVSVYASPDIPVYTDGQTVPLTASVDSGYTFIGWGGDANGSTLSTTVTMDANKRIIPIVRKDGYDQLPQLNSANLHMLPEYDTITLTGTDLAGITAARMIWTSTGQQFSAVATPQDANTLDVRMPNVTQETRNYHLFAESDAGSTIGIPEGYDEHTTIGPLADNNARGTVVVRAGAILSGLTSYETIIVETGGVFEVSLNYLLSTIVAQDGAVIDFTSVSSNMNTVLLHSPETVIIGTTPKNFLNVSIAEEVPSVKYSYGLETFMVGYPINLTIVGDGTVSASPDQQYYRANTNVDLTAIPGSNSTFSGWSGDEASSSSNLRVRFGQDPINLTATFSTGWLLSIYDIPGVSVNVSPDTAVYSDGESVTLTASVESGYTFLGWGGDASDSTPSTTVTMDGNKRVIPIVRKDGYDQIPQLTSADRHILPEGETITLTGTNLADATAARMIWVDASFEHPTTVNPLNANTLEVIMPDVSRETRDYHLIVESSAGTTIGALVAPVVVSAGSIVSSDNVGRFVIVETGGVLEVTDSYFLETIVAEDGAVIDFSGAPYSMSAKLFYSPETVIIGSIPKVIYYPTIGDIGEELTSIKPSYGLDTFTVGYELTIQIEGPGSVTANPDKQYYSYGENVELTATEDAGAFFIRWIGPISGHDQTINVEVRSSTTQIARFSTAPDYFSTWRLEHFTIEELADLSISAFDADPDRDSITNAAEYAFGTDPRDASKKYKIKVGKEKVDGEFQFFVSFTRPKNALDVTYRALLSTDLVTWNFNGDDTDLVYSEEIGAESIDDDNEEVTLRLYPQTDSPRTFFVQISAVLFE